MNSAGHLGFETASTEVMPGSPGAATLRILTLSTTFPNSLEPNAGIFVRSRVLHMAKLADLKVVAPVALVNYAKIVGASISGGDIPRRLYDQNLDVLHPRWIYPPLGGVLNPLCLALELIAPLSRLRKEFPFDLIDAHFAYPDGIAAALLARFFRCPFTVTLRGSEVLHARRRLRLVAMRYALRRADRVFAVSERLRQFALSLGVDPARAVTIPNGVDATVFFARDRAEYRRKHAIGAEERIILSVGNLIELKGHHRIVEALTGLMARGIEARLLIAGDAGRAASTEEQLRRQIHDLGLDAKVQLMGRVSAETLAELMSAADVLCLASSREGWPNVVHEALSCGLPVVATDVGAVPEMIPSDQFGLVVPVGDIPALTEALALALQKPWQRAAIAAWGKSRSWDQVAREVLHQMQSAVGQVARKRMV